MSSELSSLVVKVDKELHRKIKMNCAADGVSLKEYILGLIQKDLETREKKGDEK